MMPAARPGRSMVSLAILLSFTACAAGPEPATDPRPETVPRHDGLNSTLWVQTAAEYQGLVLQSYLQAEAMLEEALSDESWSASLEQLQAGGYGELPPAVVLDVDETVLDNSAFQARLIVDDEEYSTAIWNDWVREERATPVPGALEFTRAAARRGVAVFYLTNRRRAVEESTRANLARYGFPLTDEEDRILTQGEIDGEGDKGGRRRHIAARYRILLLIGDNLGDFVSEVEVGVEARARMAAEHADFWGRRWILLPNPQYGSWEGALFGFDYGLGPGDRRALKRSRLEEARR